MVGRRDLGRFEQPAVFGCPTGLTQRDDFRRLGVSGGRGGIRKDHQDVAEMRDPGQRALLRDGDLLRPRRFERRNLGVRHLGREDQQRRMRVRGAEFAEDPGEGRADRFADLGTHVPAARYADDQRNRAARLRRHAGIRPAS